jgi:hypothetical protein
MGQSEIIDAAKYYVGTRTNAHVFANGLILLLSPNVDTAVNVERCLKELRFKPDFQVTPFKDNNYGVWLHQIAFVVVFKKELPAQLEALKDAEGEALFPDEMFFSNGNPSEHLQIGLIGRAKIWADLEEKKEVFHIRQTQPSH